MACVFIILLFWLFIYGKDYFEGLGAPNQQNLKDFIANFSEPCCVRVPRDSGNHILFMSFFQLRHFEILTTQMYQQVDDGYNYQQIIQSFSLEYKIGNFKHVLTVACNNSPGDIKRYLVVKQTNKIKTTTIPEIVYSWWKSQVT